MNIFKGFLLFILFGNMFALAFADGPNFDRLRDSDSILDTAESRVMDLWKYFMTAIQMIFAIGFLWALAGYNLTKDEAKAAAYKKWMIRAIIATVIGGFYLGYLYS